MVHNAGKKKEKPPTSKPTRSNTTTNTGQMQSESGEDEERSSGSKETAQGGAEMGMGSDTTPPPQPKDTGQFPVEETEQSEGSIIGSPHQTDVVLGTEEEERLLRSTGRSKNNTEAAEMEQTKDTPPAANLTESMMEMEWEKELPGTFQFVEEPMDVGKSRSLFNVAPKPRTMPTAAGLRETEKGKYGSPITPVMRTVASRVVQMPRRAIQDGRLNWQDCIKSYHPTDSEEGQEAIGHYQDLDYSVKETRIKPEEHSAAVNKMVNTVTKSMYQANIEEGQNEAVFDFVSDPTGPTTDHGKYTLKETMDVETEVANTLFVKHAGVKRQVEITADLTPREEVGCNIKSGCCPSTPTHMAAWNGVYKLREETERTFNPRDMPKAPMSPRFNKLKERDGKVYAVKLRRKWGVTGDVMQTSAMELRRGIARPGTITNADAYTNQATSKTVCAFLRNEAPLEPEALLNPFLYPLSAGTNERYAVTLDESRKNRRFRMGREDGVFVWELEDTTLLEEVEYEIQKEYGRPSWEPILEHNAEIGHMTSRPADEYLLNPNWAKSLPMTQFKMVEPDMYMTADRLMNIAAPEGHEPMRDTVMPMYPNIQRPQSSWKGHKQGHEKEVNKYWKPPMTVEELGALWELGSIPPIDEKRAVFKDYFDALTEMVDESTETDFKPDFTKWVRMYIGSQSDYTVSWPMAQHIITEGLGRPLLQPMEIHHHRTVQEAAESAKHIRREREIGGLVAGSVIWDRLFIPGKTTTDGKEALETPQQQFVSYVRYWKGRRDPKNPVQLAVDKDKRIFQDSVLEYISEKLGYIPDYMRGIHWSDDVNSWTKEQNDWITAEYPVAFTFVTLRGQAHIFWLSSMFLQNPRRTEIRSEIWENLQIIPYAEMNYNKEIIQPFTVWGSLETLSRALIRSAAGAMGPLNVDFAELGTGLLGKLKPERASMGEPEVNNQSKPMGVWQLTRLTLIARFGLGKPTSVNANIMAEVVLHQRGQVRLDWPDYIEPKSTMSSEKMLQSKWNHVLNPETKEAIEQAIIEGIAMVDSMAVWAFTSDRWYRKDHRDMYTALQRPIDVMKDTIDRAFRFNDTATIEMVAPDHNWDYEEKDHRKKEFERQHPWTEKMSKYYEAITKYGKPREKRVLQSFLASARDYINDELPRAMENGQTFAENVEGILTKQMVTEHCIRMRVDVHRGLLTLFQACRMYVQSTDTTRGKGNFSFDGEIGNLVMNLSHMYYLNVNSQLQDWVRHKPLTPAGIHQLKHPVVDVMAAPRRMAAQAYRSRYMNWAYFMPTKPVLLIDDSTLQIYQTTTWFPTMFVTDRAHNGRVSFATTNVDDAQFFLECMIRQPMDREVAQMQNSLVVDFMRRYFFQLPMLWISPLIKREVICDRESDKEMDSRLKAVHNKLNQFFAVHGVPFAPTHDVEISTAWIEGALSINKKMMKGYNHAARIITEPDGLREYLSAMEYEELPGRMDVDEQNPQQGALFQREVIGPSEEPRSTLWSRDRVLEDMGMRQMTMVRASNRIYHSLLRYMLLSMANRPSLPKLRLPGLEQTPEEQILARQIVAANRAAELEGRLLVMRNAREDEVWNVLDGQVEKRNHRATRRVPRSDHAMWQNNLNMHVPLTPHQFVGDNRIPNMYADILPLGDKGLTVVSVLSQMAPRRTRPQTQVKEMINSET